MSDQELKTVCRMCHGGCGAVVHMHEGRITHLTGDKENPNNEGFLCTKGKASVELVYHRDRLQYPLKRTGPKGSGEFKRISWEEAYSLIVEKMVLHRKDFGAESIVLCQGTDRNYQEWLFRFANALGTPNVLGPAHVCFYPKMMASIFTMGSFTFCDYEGVPECIMVWGSNKIVCHSDGVIGIRLLKALKKSSQLVVIDPRKTALASKAKYWLQVKPGTDVALALGMIHVLLTHNQYDSEFVDRYTVGFEELKKHVQPYTPQKVSELTSVPAKLIEETALFYAKSKSAAIEMGTGLEQNKNSFQCVRAINILSGICGNIDKPGGDVIWEPTGVIGRRTFPRTDILPEEQKKKRLGGDQYRILSMSGWAHSDAVWKAILEETPYPVKSMFVFGSNLLLLYANSERVYQALKKIDFLMVADLFLTPTAEMADVVLPISSWLERDQIVEQSSYVATRKKFVQVGECKSDEEVLNTLAQKLNLKEHFWNTVEEALDYKLRPLGRSWKTFTSEYYLANQLEYYKYKKMGFKTRSGKYHLYCEGLRQLGYDPLPVFKPIVDKEEGISSYILTSHHSPHYFNSEFRSLSRLRKLEPDPTIEIHPQSAKKEGIGEGDWVLVSIREKQAQFKARITDKVAPPVVHVSASWWYPELPFDEKWKRSNVNRITSEEGANAEMGSSNFRGIACRVRRKEPADG